MTPMSSYVRWVLGGILFTFIFAIVAFGLALTSGRRIFPIVRSLCRILLRVMGVRIRVTGLDRFDGRRYYLYMGNHQSMFDLFLVPAVLPTHAVGVEAAYHFKLPLWGHLTRRWGNIPIHRSDRSRAIASLETAAGVLRSGSSIVVLPEGHRTLDGEIGTFKKGPFHLARAAGADLLPFVITGLFEYCPKGSPELRPTTARVHFDRPIPYAEIRDRSVAEIMDMVRNRMVAIHQQLSAMGKKP